MALGDIKVSQLRAGGEELHQRLQETKKRKKRAKKESKREKRQKKRQQRAASIVGLFCLYSRSLLTLAHTPGAGVSRQQQDRRSTSARKEKKEKTGGKKKAGQELQQKKCQQSVSRVLEVRRSTSAYKDAKRKKRKEDVNTVLEDRRSTSARKEKKEKTGEKKKRSPAHVLARSRPSLAWLVMNTYWFRVYGLGFRV